MRDLVLGAKKGDRDAFAALVGLTSDRMYALAARILRDNDLAEDALQAALITVWRQLPTLRDPDRFEAWVRRLLAIEAGVPARLDGFVAEAGVALAPRAAGLRAPGPRRERFGRRVRHTI